MNKNKIVPIIIGLVIIVAIIFIVKNNNSSSNGTTSAPHETTNPGAVDQTGGTGGTTNNAGKTYTLAQIATHNNESSCWTTINGGVYDVTTWISQHPGGRDAILSLCGKDGSSAFNDQHGGQRRPEAELASFKIGTLATQ